MSKSFNSIIRFCAAKQITLSEQQSLVLEIICRHNNPVTAHLILNNLKEINPKANRMTIHRSLDYLNQVNVIHKITFNNTYSACNHIEEQNCQLFVCEKCGKKLEFHSQQILDVIKKSSLEYEFAITNPIEIMGICKECL